ncbi:hypothetical protein GYA27_04340 [candidate division WWE3 bacterium]|uniref:DUF5673 domain-containing protein n=1 Tax=candidate division WWE3 bacterium TaxID=2053526 RepID=A0A7X9DL56_UNCKA|nr:hypothetical protein [candidate division WWE3 bacterium]
MKLSFAGVSDLLGLNNIVPTVKPRQPNVDIKALGEKKILLSWEADSRPHTTDVSEQRMTRTYTVIGVVIALVLIILQEFFLLLLIGSMLFVRYVLAKVPPEKINYTLSTHGITIGPETYYWKELLQYFFMDGVGEHVVAVDIEGAAMPRLFISFHPKDKETIKEILDQHLIYLETPPKSAFDKTYETIMSKLTLK